MQGIRVAQPVVVGEINSEMDATPSKPKYLDWKYPIIDNLQDQLKANRTKRRIKMKPRLFFQY